MTSDTVRDLEETIERARTYIGGLREAAADQATIIEAQSQALALQRAWNVAMTRALDRIRNNRPPVEPVPNAYLTDLQYGLAIGRWEAGQIAADALAECQAIQAEGAA